MIYDRHGGNIRDLFSSFKHWLPSSGHIRVPTEDPDSNDSDESHDKMLQHKPYTDEEGDCGDSHKGKSVDKDKMSDMPRTLI